MERERVLCSQKKSQHTTESQKLQFCPSNWLWLLSKAKNSMSVCVLLKICSLYPNIYYFSIALKHCAVILRLILVILALDCGKFRNTMYYEDTPCACVCLYFYWCCYCHWFSNNATSCITCAYSNVNRVCVCVNEYSSPPLKGLVALTGVLIYLIQICKLLLLKFYTLEQKYDFGMKVNIIWWKR